MSTPWCLYIYTQPLITINISSPTVLSSLGKGVAETSKSSLFVIQMGKLRPKDFKGLMHG